MKIEILNCRPKGEERPTPLLFVHGAFAGAWIWAEYFLPFFASHGYACHALSLRGHGDSEGHDGLNQHDLDDYVLDLIAAADRVGRPAVVIGHSMGGMVVQRFLANHRRAAAAAVLMASVPPDGLAASGLHMMMRHPQLIYALTMLQNFGPERVLPEAVFHSLFSDDMPKDEAFRYFPMMQQESQRVAQQLMGWMMPPSPKPSLPMLVMGGDRDAFVPKPALRGTASYYGADLAILDGLPHVLMLDVTWRRAAEHMLTWLGSKGF